jgi:hypothetical protein
LFDRSVFIKLSVPKVGESREGGEEMRIEETTTVIPVIGVAKGT